MPTAKELSVIYDRVFGTSEPEQVKPVPKKKCIPGLCTVEPAPETRNEDMYVSQDVTVTEHTTIDAIRSHFLGRLNEVRSTKSHDLKVKYGLAASEAPTTIKDLVARIKGGEYKLSTQLEDEESEIPGYSDIWDYILWNPAKVDRKGHKKAYDELEILVDKARDSLWAETDSSKYPSILEKFEKATVH